MGSCRLVCSAPAGSVRTGQLRICWPFTRWMMTPFGTDHRAVCGGVHDAGLASFASTSSARATGGAAQNRVMFWGTMLSLVQRCLLAIQSLTSVRWPECGAVQLALLLSRGVFAYAVVVHRVLDFGVLKRSARYSGAAGVHDSAFAGQRRSDVDVRRFTPGYLRHVAEIGQHPALRWCVFGTTLLWSGSRSTSASAGGLTGHSSQRLRCPCGS